MSFDHEITCIGRDGLQAVFRYEKEITSKDWHEVSIFRIVPENEEFEDWFEFAVTKIDNSTGKVTAMAHNKIQAYIAKGIPEKMIEESATTLNLQIISSSNKPEFKALSTEWRSVDGGKPWKRLVEQGKAIYDDEQDIFRFVG